MLREKKEIKKGGEKKENQKVLYGKKIGNES